MPLYDDDIPDRRETRITSMSIDLSYTLEIQHDGGTIAEIDGVLHCDCHMPPEGPLEWEAVAVTFDTGAEVHRPVTKSPLWALIEEDIKRKEKRITERLEAVWRTRA